MILANNDAGLYKFRLELLEELVKNHEVLICLPDGDYIENMVELGCQFIPCTCLERQGTNPFKDLKLIKFYADVLKKHNIKTVYHGHSHGSGLHKSVSEYEGISLKLVSCDCIDFTPFRIIL